MWKEMKVRRFSERDIETRVSWVNTPRINRFMHFDIPLSVERTTNWYHNALTNSNRVDLVFENEKNERVAMGGLTSIDYKNRKAELYVFVNPNILSKGKGTQATILLCNYAFKILKLHKVYLYTNQSNVIAQRVYEKIGFVLEGQFREDYYTDGGYEDRKYYGLLDRDFKYDENLIFIG